MKSHIAVKNTNINVCFMRGIVASYTTMGIKMHSLFTMVFGFSPVIYKNKNINFGMIYIVIAERVSLL